MKNRCVKFQRALISVTDKSGLDTLVRALIDYGVEIVSTGGTKKYIESLGYDVTPISSVTGNPEAFGGRMKTLSFQVESGILFRRQDPKDVADAKKLGIAPIDLVVCNLYPFEEVARQKRDEDDLIENIDIGGPTMIRAAAKNFDSVATLTSPGQYATFVDEYQARKGEISYETRRRLSILAFEKTAHYDFAIYCEFKKRFDSEESVLRYGENPHQEGYFLPSSFTSGIGGANILQGKKLSYNNWLDAEAAWKIGSDLHLLSQSNNECKGKFGAVVVKHLNPCGAALADNLLEALNLAWQGDPVSAFGSIIAFSAPLDEGCANWLADKFVEVIVCPGISKQAREVLKSKKNLRVLVVDLKKDASEKEWVHKSLLGGHLIQSEDEGLDREFQNVTRQEFPPEKLGLGHFGLVVTKYLKSNAIGIVHQTDRGDFYLAGAGMGQPNRIDSLKRLAWPRAKEKGIDLSECVLVSDAFFPFADTIETAHQCGIKAIIQPGGSRRDNEVIDACNQHHMAMVFTNRRHFRH